MLTDEHVFTLFMERFDKIDNDNASLQVSIDNHIKEDAVVHKVVDKHSTYWSLLLWIGGALLAVATSVAAAYIH